MNQYRITAEETAIVNYYVRADSEDEARALLARGEFDDYRTEEAAIEDILEVTLEAEGA